MKTGTLEVNFKNAGNNCKFYIFKNATPNCFDQIQELSWYYKFDFANGKILINYKSEVQYETSGCIESLPIECGKYFIFSSLDNFHKAEELVIADGFVTQYSPEAEMNKNAVNAYYDALMDLIY